VRFNEEATMSTLKKFVAASLLSAMSVAAQANDCPSCTDSRASESKASEGLSVGAGMVVLGSMSMLVGSGTIIVQSVESIADGVTVVIKGSATAASVTLKLSGKAFNNIALASGTVLEVSVVSTGYLFISAGKAIAFIPNELGNGLLYHAKAR
jgi:hypothetical protein